MDVCDKHPDCEKKFDEITNFKVDLYKRTGEITIHMAEVKKDISYIKEGVMRTLKDNKDFKESVQEELNKKMDRTLMWKIISGIIAGAVLIGTLFAALINLRISHFEETIEKEFERLEPINN